MRTPSYRRVKPSYHPHLLTLEERLPLGDGVFGLLASAALLPRAMPAIVPPTPQPAGAPGTSLVGRIANPSGGLDGLAIRPTEAAFAAAPSAAVVAPDWVPLTDPFATPAGRPRATFPQSPPLEHGADATSLLAPRAGEERGAPPLRLFMPTVVAAPHGDPALLRTLAALYQPAAPARAAATTPAQEAQVKENFGKLPLTFEENVGQTDAAVQFFTRGPGYGLYLTSTEAVMVLNKPTPAKSDDLASDRLDAGRAGPHTTGMNPVARNEEPPAVVRMQLVGANATPSVTGRDAQPGKVNYFLGNDSSKWHTNIATFGRVHYDDVYPGIDLVWYGTNRQLEYDFVVAAGADPTQIRLRFAHAARLELDAAGDLLVQAGDQTLRQHQPVVYQEVHGTRHEVASRFVLDEASGGRPSPEVRFALGAYDAARPLVIDPVLSYSTYLGGSNADGGYSLALDAATGDAFLTGSSRSVNFPTVNPLQLSQGGGVCGDPEPQPCPDAFVSRLSADGSTLRFSTYLGGSRDEWGTAAAAHPATGDIVLTGYTFSSNFPTASPLQAANAGSHDVFLTRLRADGAALVYSTYLGGRGPDYAAALAVDPTTGDSVLTGYTQSLNFPTAGALQGNLRGLSNVFVTRLREDGAALVYSTYLGGWRYDVARALALDPATGDALITGETTSTDFPMANPLQAVLRGFTDPFVARLRADGSGLIFSTYFGGGREDYGAGLAVDAATGDVFLTGYTYSDDFPTANALQDTNRGASDVYVTRLRPDGQRLIFSTYLGGTSSDFGRTLVVDPVTGDAVLVGYSRSTDFPTANPLQGSHRGLYDVIVVRLRSDGAALLSSTYLGGSNWDYATSVAVSPVSGEVTLTGFTESPDFPTTREAFDTSCGTDGNCDGYFDPKVGWSYYSDAFVTRIGSALVASYSVYPDSGAVQAGVPFDLYVYALDADGNVLPDYTGEIVFFSSDKQATLPKPYTFLRTDQGVAYFFEGVTFLTPGTQELYVLDTATYKVFGYAAFDVRP